MFTILIAVLAFLIGRHLGRHLDQQGLKTLTTATPEEIGDALKTAVVSTASFIAKLYAAGTTTKQWLKATLDEAGPQLQPIALALTNGLRLAQTIPTRFQR